jgi:hypothetical protein
MIDAYAAGLTVDPEKSRYYAQDCYYRETVQQLSTWDPEERRRLLATRSYLMFKPEALVERKVGPALAYLAERGIEANLVASVTINRSVLRAMWWYQLNAAPLTIVRACDVLMNGWEMLLIGFVDAKADPDDSAARRLSDMKGSSRDIGKGLGLLRDELGCTTTCLNYIHAPDEPADVVREIGVMFDRPRREAIFEAFRQEPDADAVNAAVESAYLRHEPRDLGLDGCVQRLRAAVGPEERKYVDGIEHAIASSEDDYDDRLTLVDWLCETDVVARWDRAVIAAHVTGMERADVMPMIGPPPGIRHEFRRAEVAEKQARNAARQTGAT